ncbi:hypothetical protein [Nocardiopsis metallicus]|uniref:Uncharacterized protein n=1 Tax=Nocardiopsis metallicus TaxID=179819 RepID=A0A840WBG1_9ACTN|nr:hypothetical protein [Nocardiopsis metallicus]MBB5494380.1 hypothetical protein [Nocardiopsis metallicus]
MTTAALVLALAVLSVLGVVQALILVGFPLGEYVWGGQARVPTPRLRWSAAIALVILPGFALLLASRAGLLPGGGSPAIVIATWVLFTYSVLMVGLNAVSRSRPERLTATPASALLALSTFVIALGS